METNLNKMKEDYDQLVPGLSLDYEKLKFYMYLRKAKKGMVLKEANSVEKCSRYICEGFLGLMKQKEEPEESIQLLNALMDLGPTRKLKLSGFRSESIKNVLFTNLHQLIPSISIFGNDSWKVAFHSSWKDYLMAQNWEVQNRKNGQIPLLSEFKEKRLFSSGVYLALHLLKKDWDSQDCSISWLERKVAQLICLTNDLKSVEKERMAQDFHNELLLLQIQTGCSTSMVYDYAKSQIRGLFDQLFNLLKLMEKEDEYAKNWVDRLLLLLGGCLYWSEEDTVRYGNSINGISKF